MNAADSDSFSESAFRQCTCCEATRPVAQFPAAFEGGIFRRSTCCQFCQQPERLFESRVQQAARVSSPCDRCRLPGAYQMPTARPAQVAPAQPRGGKGNR